MNDADNKAAGSDQVERLLGRAEPRPVPPAEDARMVREAVRAQWQQQVRRRRRRRNSLLALAATIVAGFGMALFLGESEVAMSPGLAEVEKSFGSTYLVQADSGLVLLENVRTLSPGQTVQTARSSGLGLRINGASVRLDADSRVRLVDSETIYLQRGRVYVDTDESPGVSRILVRTDQGSITHLGTQFIVAIASDELTVSVREGEVRIDGKFYDAQASVGERVRLKGTNRPVADRVAGYGGLWQWAEALAPQRTIDGLPADRFLEWVGQETGYRIVFADESARELVTEAVLEGLVNKAPREELRIRLLTMGLAFDMDDARGEIRIRDPGE